MTDTQSDISTPTEFVARDHHFGDANPGYESHENPPSHKGKSILVKHNTIWKLELLWLVCLLIESFGLVG